MNNIDIKAAAADLAPSGTLRAAINFGNAILAGKDPDSGEPRGVSVDLARELARQLGLPLEFVTYTGAGKVVEAAKANAWDVAFAAIDPLRGMEMDYTDAYVIIEGGYMVRQDAPISRNQEVDRQGVRIVVGAGSAYDLYLTREIKHAALVRAPTSQLVTDTMLAQGCEVAANVMQQLQADAARIPGMRMLDGRFMAINQAMATPKNRPAGMRFLRGFVAEAIRSGLVAAALQRHGIEGATVAPAPTATPGSNR